MWQWILVSIPLFLSITACTSVQKTAITAETTKLGSTATNAIEVCEPRGEREYLSRRVCASGDRPTFRRQGNVGERNPLPANLSTEQESALFSAIMSGGPLRSGEIDYRTIDTYEVVCDGTPTTIYMDMYHCGSAREKRAPSGFTIQN